MNDKVIKMITEYRPFEQGDKVLVGLSGGADSVALLDFLWRNRETFGIEIIACHVNHMLRGHESDRDESFVRELCSEMKIPITVHTADINKLSKERGLSIELMAREVRYSFFEEISRRENAKIATAHTLSDSMETIILNLARGTGLRGLTGIPAMRGNIIRPLIYATREEIEEYIKEQGLSYVVDSTNYLDDYTRNKIRHHIIPKIFEINSDADTVFLRMIEAVKLENDYLERGAKELLDDVKTERGYSIERFQSADEVLKRRAILYLLRSNNIETSSDKILNILSSLNTQTLMELKEGTYIKITDSDFYITQRTILREYFEERIEKEKLLITEKIQPFDGKNVKFTIYNCEQQKNSEKSNDCVLKNCIDYDRICGNVVLRQKIAGDSIKIPKRAVTKTLKKLFSENGLSALDKSERIIIADDIGVLFVEGFGTDDRAATNENTRTKIFVSICGGR